MGLLLARDDVLRRRFDADPDLDGVPPFAAGRLRILASDQAHFSVARNAAILGLGERCVVLRGLRYRRAGCGPTRWPRRWRRSPTGTRSRSPSSPPPGPPISGAIDPLVPIAKVAARHGAWFHVDAAYGGGLLLGTVADARLHGPARRRLRHSGPAQARLAAGAGGLLPGQAGRVAAVAGEARLLPELRRRRAGRLPQPARPLAAHHAPGRRREARRDLPGAGPRRLPAAHRPLPGAGRLRGRRRSGSTPTWSSPPSRS